MKNNNVKLFGEVEKDASRINKILENEIDKIAKFLSRLPDAEIENNLNFIKKYALYYQSDIDSFVIDWKERYKTIESIREKITDVARHLYVEDKSNKITNKRFTAVKESLQYIGYTGIVNKIREKL